MTGTVAWFLMSPLCWRLSKALSAALRLKVWPTCYCVRTLNGEDLLISSENKPNLVVKDVSVPDL